MLTKPSEDHENDTFLKNYSEFKSTQDYEDRLFAAYVSENPLAASKYALSIPNHSTSEQGEFFSAIRSTLTKTQKLEWAPILSLIESLVDGKRSEHLIDACAILEKGLEHNLIDYSFKERIWILIQKLLAIDDPYISDITFNHDIGSLTYSINSIDGMSFHLLFRYMKWYMHNEQSHAVPQNIKQVLENYQNTPDRYTITRHGVIGFFFNLLFSLDMKYALNLFYNISKSDEFKIYFWSSYVLTNPVREILVQLRSTYDEFLSGTITLDLHNTMLYCNTIEHVTLGHLYDVDGFSDLFQKFIRNADEESIDNCSLFILARLKNSDVDRFIDKIHSLWKEPKFIKSKHTGSWFLNSPINKTSIDLYLNYLKTYPKNFTYLYFPTKTFAKYMGEFSLEVARCIEVFFYRCPVMDTLNVKPLISALLETDNLEIIEICNKVNRISSVYVRCQDLA